MDAEPIQINHTQQMGYTNSSQIIKQTIGRLVFPTLCLGAVILIPSDILYTILTSIESRTDLKILHLLILLYVVYSIYQSIEVALLGTYTSNEFSQAEEFYGDSLINILFVCMIFGNTINTFYIPLMFLILLIKMNTRILLNRVKMGFNTSYIYLSVINTTILSFIALYFVNQKNFIRGLPSYILYDTTTILTNYITIYYHLFIVKDRDEGDYMNIPYHIHSIFVVFLSLMIKLGFLIATSYVKRVPFNIFRNFWSDVYRFKKKLHGFVAFLRIEKLLKDAENVSGMECPICTDDITSNIDNNGEDTAETRGKRLGCGHSFHISCLKLWVLQQQVCPVCRVSVFDSTSPDSDEGEGDDQGFISTLLNLETQ